MKQCSPVSNVKCSRVLSQRTHWVTILLLLEHGYRRGTSDIFGMLFPAVNSIIAKCCLAMLRMNPRISISTILVILSDCSFILFWPKSTHFVQTKSYFFLLFHIVCKVMCNVMQSHSLSIYKRWMEWSARGSGETHSRRGEEIKSAGYTGLRQMQWVPSAN